jgi:hypothetical protein
MRGDFERQDHAAHFAFGYPIEESTKDSGLLELHPGNARQGDLLTSF